MENVILTRTKKRDKGKRNINYLSLNHNNCIKNISFKFVFSIFICLIIFIIWKLISKKNNVLINTLNNSPNSTNQGQKIPFDKNFDYRNYQREVITDELKQKAGWILSPNDVYFLNGLIRKHRPVNILEIGSAYGGSANLILNAIKDIPDSKLISMDLYESFNNKKIGYLVKERFPELMNKWQLFAGDMPYKALIKLNMKFDFFYLDSAHIRPGELFNIIEALPFLNENAIVVLHDTHWHLDHVLHTEYTLKEATIMPTQIYLLSALVGEKIVLYDEKNNLFNIGAICLESNQNKHLVNYFLLLNTLWQYMPTDDQLNGFREFIDKYYEEKLLLKIYDDSVEYNKIYFQNIKENKYRKG